MIDIYTDGGCSNCIGGIGIIFVKDNKIIKQYFNKYINTTNNQMELGAVLIALSFITESGFYVVYSDSKYVIEGILGNYSLKKNKRLWDRLKMEYERVKSICDIKFVHVKGHSDNYYNNLCDKLAVQARQLL